MPTLTTGELGAVIDYLLADLCAWHERVPAYDNLQKSQKDTLRFKLDRIAEMSLWYETRQKQDDIPF